MNRGTFVFRDPSEKHVSSWRAVINYHLQRPTWNSKKAAQAFVSGALKGSRKLENVS